jgi:hypothetical protein
MRKKLYCAALVTLAATGVQARDIEPHFYYKLQTGSGPMIRTAYESADDAFIAFKLWQQRIQQEREGDEAGMTPVDIHPTPVADYYNGMPKAYSFSFSRPDDCPKACDGGVLVSLEIECPAHTKLEVVAMTRKSYSAYCSMPANEPLKPSAISCSNAKGKAENQSCPPVSGCYPGIGKATGNSYCFPYTKETQVKVSAPIRKK